MKVLGQYACGCSYGPVEKNKRLNYCGIHGDDIQDEYPYIPEPVDPPRSLGGFKEVA